MNDFDSFSARAARDWLSRNLITCRPPPQPDKKPTPPNLGYIFRQLYSSYLSVMEKNEVHKIITQQNPKKLNG